MVRFSSSSVAAIDSQTPFSTSGTSISRLGIGFLAVRLWSGNLFYPIRREMSSMRTTPAAGTTADQRLTTMDVALRAHAQFHLLQRPKTIVGKPRSELQR